MRPISEIVIHCTATRKNWWEGRTTSAKVEEVRRWHKEDRGWSDIGYHYLIDRDGTVATGRPIERVGAHVKDKNTGKIGVVLFGGHGSAATDGFAEHYTPAQDQALRDLLAQLRRRFPAITKISGHNEYAAKACPGFTVAHWLVEPGPPVRPDVEPAPKPRPTKPAAGKSEIFAAFIAAVAALFAYFIMRN